MTTDESTTESAGGPGEAPVGDAAPARPHLRIVRGEPTPEELAVVTALVAAAAAGPDDGGRPQARRGRWADPFDAHRRPWQTGPGGWRAASRH